ncbi:MAG TPA: DUF3017 domain-containing protein [Nocardioides sp.]|nr:DUF3017 domain-containing protein [Nocardioides sp.]
MLYLVVLVVTLAGLVVVATADWRTGVRIVSGALVGAALVRAALPERDAGMLVVRHRALDVVLLAAIAVALFFLAGSIPDQPLG